MRREKSVAVLPPLRTLAAYRSLYYSKIFYFARRIRWRNGNASFSPEISPFYPRKGGGPGKIESSPSMIFPQGMVTTTVLPSAHTISHVHKRISMINCPHQCCYHFSRTNHGVVVKAFNYLHQVPGLVIFYLDIHISKIKFIYFCHLKLIN
jgi:hypothetical protein